MWHRLLPRWFGLRKVSGGHDAGQPGAANKCTPSGSGNVDKDNSGGSPARRPPSLRNDGRRRGRRK